MLLPSGGPEHRHREGGDQVCALQHLVVDGGRSYAGLAVPLTGGSARASQSPPSQILSTSPRAQKLQIFGGFPSVVAGEPAMGKGDGLSRP